MGVFVLFKSEARISKSETSTNDQNLNDQNKNADCCFEHLIFENLILFRYSEFDIQIYFFSMPARINSRKSGCGRWGRDLNSGWN